MDPYPSHSFLKTYDIAPTEVVAFSTRREGGCSTGTYSSFNANAFCGDKPEDVRSNRFLLCEALNITPERLIIPHQTHQTRVINIDAEFLSMTDEERSTRLEGIDALITQESSTCISVSTADCVPLLYYDAEHKAIAAVHAGWRGTLSRIGSITLQAMQELYGTEPSDLKVIIGPSISLDSFEVGQEVYDAFHEAGFPMGEIAKLMATNGSGEKWHIDLWKANTLLLESEGVLPDSIYVSGICTYQNYEEYFSARRLGAQSGRILNGIMILE